MTVSQTQIPSEIIDHDVLFSRLSAGHTLVTGNSRLSRVLSQSYSQWRMARGDRQWPSPHILPWAAWLNELWETTALQSQVDTTKAVPAPRQLINLWERVLKADSYSRFLLRPESLASVLRDTRSLVREWQLDLSDQAWFGEQNENHTAFQRWNRAFEHLCNLEEWIAPEDLASLLVQSIREHGTKPGQVIDLLGFDELNPLQSGLLATLHEHGTPITRLSLTPRPGKAVLWQGKDAKRELNQMARWVRYWYENDPGSEIAIVVPDLQSRRSEVERHLQEILVPNRSDMEHGHLPWNISMGRPLAREPLVQTAFDLLKLLNSRFDIQDVGRVLRSPWLSGGRSERNSRALLEKCLRDNHPRQLKLSELRYRSRELNRFDRARNELPPDLHEPQPWNSPKFSAVLERLTRFQSSGASSRLPSQWAEQLDQLLVSIGWPLKGEARSTEQNDRNWQALQAWRECLRELSSLDVTAGTLSCPAAISQLQRICRERVFQPVSAPARIQVLGLYEVSGLRFDHLWVLGLHNDNWPPTATPNPFVPAVLQRAAQIPHSSPQRELEVARTITRRLLETAPDCVFSYPGQLDGEDVLASPLLLSGNIETVASVPAADYPRWQTRVFDAPGPATDPLNMPGPLTTDTARGGSSILKHQALCPFRAFATNRLGAEGLDSPADGISPKLHGSLVHKVLENFWKETKSWNNLSQLDDASLRQRVRNQVERVVEDEIFLQQRPRFAQVEANRLERQALASLALDRTREPFTVVEFEQEILPVLEGQPVRLVIDRIDRLESGEKVIIDYKTGKVDPKKWFGDRPEDPQLPLYAISSEETPAAVVFGVVRDDGCLYNGVVGREGILPDLPPRATAHKQELIDAGVNMPDTIANWREVLHRLMADFLAGEAQIDPKNGRSTCKNHYCDLQALCRIDELDGQPGFAYEPEESE